jgi:predicted AAA+ superfamily ATPase
MLEDFFTKSIQFIKLNNLKYKRYFVKQSHFEHRLSILIGARGIGKSVTLSQYMSDFDIQKEALYISLDDILANDINLYEIAQNFYLHGGKLLCLDEIHKYSNWSQELKNIYDNFQDLKVIASGSSALEIEKGSFDLSRRAIVYNMVGMSFREFLELNYPLKLGSYTLDDILKNHIDISTDIIEKLKTIDKKVLETFKEYLRYGYYPYFTNFENKILFFKTLKQNINTTIESDLLNIYPSLTGRSTKKIKQLLAIIMQNVPFTPTISTLKKDIEVKDDRTLKEYLYYLDKSSLIKLLMKNSISMKNIDKPEKIYLENTNLMYITNPNIGNVRETFFVNQLSNYYVVNEQIDFKGIFSSKVGDFILEDEYIIEVGGAKKSFKQVKDIKNSFVVADDIEIGYKAKIPLWLFGFLY